jgi:membrane peptidoglycan carboxypeptidase
VYPSPVVSWYVKHRRRLLLGTVATAGLLTLGSFLYGSTCGLHGCPSIRQIKAYHPDYRTVRLDQVPENLRHAFIAVEDRRFADHNGIDWRAFGRAFIRNTTSLGVREGASTITMQVARGAFISDDECDGRSFARKLVELRLAPRIEKALTKNQILALYLNLIYLGDGVYGVEAASRHYFNKNVSRLSLAESAMLAAMPRAPEVYDPERHPERATERRNLVLGLMAQEGFITEAQAEKAAGQELRVARSGGSPRRAGSPPVVQVATGNARRVTEAVGSSCGG